METVSEYRNLALAADSMEVLAGQGKNRIPEPEKEPLWKRYLQTFHDPLIIVLLVALLLSCFVSGYEIYTTGNWHLLFEPMGVLFAILLATGVGFIFEVKAEKEFEVLNQVNDTQPVKVLRRATAGAEPQLCSIPKTDVVVGDIIRIESGDQMPADGVLLESNALRVDESVFTGEPYANKSATDAEEEETAYPKNRLLRGSTVIEGNGYYLVDAIAADTEEGKGVTLTHEGKEVKTPLNRQLDQLGRMISVASFIIAGLIVVGRMVYFFFFDGDVANNSDALAIFSFILQSLMIAITLIVVAVPEGLPMSITVSLALSMRKMLKEKNLVRKLHACETMGAATVICTDKTGTLTQNQMSVVASKFFGGENAARAMALNSTAELTTADGASQNCSVIGNPTEGALLKWVMAQGEDYRKLRREAQILSQKPFSSETKSMETIVQLPADENSMPTRVLYLKGAPEILLERCEALPEGVTREEIQALLADYQSRAMRTLGFAYQHIADDDEVSSVTESSSLKGRSPLTFMGVVGIADPIRSDVAEAIRECKEDAGVKVIIVTGDTVGTANEIGRQIGLLAEGETDKTLQGPDFAARKDEELRQLLRENQIRIIARARPEDKARLVRLLQQNHEVVAVTGDGTNDAPALSKAQVGLSMGSGTSRAKDASDITIIDDSFASINKAIMWGRSIYLNIRRFIVFQMTINVCACLIVLLGAFVGLDSPLNVTQMLWVNLIMDTFAAGALSSLPADKRVLHDKPRSHKAHIIDRGMALNICAWGLGFCVILVGLWRWLLADKPALTTYEHGIFFSTFVVLQFWNLFNTRYLRTDRSFLFDVYDFFFCRERFLAFFSSGFLLVALVIIIGQFLIVNELPEFFEVEPLSIAVWLTILAATSPVFILPEIYRTLRIMMKRKA